MVETLGTTVAMKLVQGRVVTLRDVVRNPETREAPEHQKTTEGAGFLDEAPGTWITTKPCVLPRGQLRSVHEDSNPIMDVDFHRIVRSIAFAISLSASPLRSHESWTLSNAAHYITDTERIVVKRSYPLEFGSYRYWTGMVKRRSFILYHRQ